MAVPQMIAEHLSWPRATVVTHFEYNKDNNSAVVKRTIEGGKEESIELKGPFIVSANKGLNKPRYASLPGIMKAKKKTINAHKLEDLGVNSDDFRVEYFETRLPEEKAPGQIFKGDAKELAAKITTVLKDEVKVI